MTQNSQIESAVLRAASRIKLLVLDCDGVLTDGKIYFSAEGEAMKAFHVHDGQGIKMWQKAGFRTAVITARRSPIAEARAEELGIEFVMDGVADKAAALDDLMGTTQLGAEQIAYVGDDISDLGPLRRVGFPIAVANCADALRESVIYITSRTGGSGAVREVTDLLLSAKETEAS
ncbi:MAG: HAD hydrolase family protein [Acidobacteriota bacterium]|nr:MAG: HAD hydrolase family protein [Acidobacteriota bacterium]